jgi:hypothetical protein
MMKERKRKRLRERDRYREGGGESNGGREVARAKESLTDNISNAALNSPSQ